MKLQMAKIILILGLLISASFYSPKVQAIDTKVKAILTMAAYGTVGGALLGTASLAFDTKGRSPFIGASLGLYAGLIFGSYVVVSHRLKKYRDENPQPQQNYYPDSNSPYEAGSDGGFGSWFGGGEEEVVEDPQYWNPTLNLENLGPTLDSHSRINGWGRSVNRHRPVFYLNLMNYQF